MLRNFVTYCSTLACLSGISLAEQTYEDHGFSFQHGDSERVTVTGEKIKTIRIEGPGNSLFMVQNYGKSVTPEKLRNDMTSSLLKQFENDAIELTHKSASRALLGEPRSGHYILFTKHSIPSESLLFTFEKNGDTICVITQMALQHSRDAERMFATIQKSLSIIK